MIHHFYRRTIIRPIPIRPIPLACRWVATGNPRQPLACVWTVTIITASEQPTGSDAEIYLRCA